MGRARRRNNSVCLWKGKHFSVDSASMKCLSLLLRLSCWHCHPTATCERTGRRAHPSSNTSSMSLPRSEGAELCWEAPGAPWLSHKSHSVRGKIDAPRLGTPPMALAHAHPDTHTHSRPEKPSSPARTQAQEKVRSQGQLNCFHDFPAAFGRQIGGLVF